MEHDGSKPDRDENPRQYDAAETAAGRKAFGQLHFGHGAWQPTFVRRPVVVLFSLLMIAAAVWPATTSPPRDSFPLSNYPMFAADRPTEARFATVVATDPDGRTDRLSPRTIGGTDQVIQAAATVAQAVRNGEAEQLCREILGRLDDPVRVEVVTETYDTIEWFDGNETPISRTVHATCEGPS
jgi:hypothetical protein